MQIWYNEKKNKLIMTLDLKGFFLVSEDGYGFNGKSFSIRDLVIDGYIQIGSL